MKPNNSLTVIGTINDVDIRSTANNKVRLNDIEIALNIPKKLSSSSFVRDNVDVEDAKMNGFLEIRKGRFGGTFVRRDQVTDYLEWLNENGFDCAGSIEAMIKPVASLLDDMEQVEEEDKKREKAVSTDLGVHIDNRLNGMPLDGDECHLMSSDDLLRHVNTARGGHGESAIRRNVFIARIKDELEGEHYKNRVVKNPNGTVSSVLMLSHDQCMVVSMRESKAVRRTVLAVINDLKAQQVEPTINVPQTYAEALRLAAGQAEEIERQQVLIEQAAPKVEFVDRYVESTGTKTFREVAKILDVTEVDFREYLDMDKVCYRVNGVLVPYSDKITAGYCEVKTGERNGHAWTQTRFTPKGIAWMASRIKKKKKKRRTGGLRPRSDLFDM